MAITNNTYLGYLAGLGTFAGTGGYGRNYSSNNTNPYLQGPGRMGAPSMQGMQPNFDAQQMAQLQALQNQINAQQNYNPYLGQQNPYAQQYEELFRENSVKQPTKKPKPVKAVKPVDTVRRLDLDGGGEVATPAVVARQIDF